MWFMKYPSLPHGREIEILEIYEVLKGHIVLKEFKIYCAELEFPEGWEVGVQTVKKNNKLLQGRCGYFLESHTLLWNMFNIVPNNNISVKYVYAFKNLVTAQQDIYLLICGCLLTLNVTSPFIDLSITFILNYTQDSTRIVYITQPVSLSGVVLCLHWKSVSLAFEIIFLCFFFQVTFPVDCNTFILKLILLLLFFNILWLILSGRGSFRVHIMMAWMLCLKSHGMFEMCTKAYSKEQRTFRMRASLQAVVQRKSQSLKILVIFHVLTTLLPSRFLTRYSICCTEVE